MRADAAVLKPHGRIVIDPLPAAFAVATSTRLIKHAHTHKHTSTRQAGFKALRRISFVTIISKILEAITKSAAAYSGTASVEYFLTPAGLDRVSHPTRCATGQAASCDKRRVSRHFARDWPEAGTKPPLIWTGLKTPEQANLPPNETNQTWQQNAVE